HAGGHPHRRLARRAAATAARVADAVLLPVGVVGVPGPELLRDGGVILAAGIGVADQQGDRRAGGAALVDAAEDVHLVGLAPLRGVAAAAGGAPGQVVGEVVRRQLDARRAAIHHAADGRPVALAEGGDAQQAAEAV